ncbi:esterase/lipase [Mycolicibacterium aurum]|uniref:Esterase/lipase n=2 Tax=Mycolicibacterium aurum TaxID=1791 RepID=A0A3S4VI14_MYCAU|nr:esterase/lipase [Mycolicibacterium aurum]
MVDRYRVWLGAGVLAGGMSAAMLVGAGVASADDAASSNAQPSSGSDDTGDKADSDKGDTDEADTDTSDRDPSGVDDTDDSAAGPALDDDADESGAADETETAGSAGHRRKSRAAERQAEPTSSGVVETADRPGVAGGDDASQPMPESDQEPEAGPALGAAPAESADTEPAADEDAIDIDTPTPFVSSIETDLGSSGGAAVMQIAATRAAWPGSTGAPNLFTVISDVFSNVYTWYTDTMQFIAGPARAPFGSRVRVESSDLIIGDGAVVSADWYFPPGSTPTGLIYFQHGMLATSRFYSATAAYLAEKTNSIVVAPTLTWNPFDWQNYPLMLPSTHRAIADLFTGDRTALTASAQAAGWRGTLPTRLVLAGHSAGGGLVVGTARYLVQNGDARTLAGVVMLDGAGIGGLIDLDLAKIPHSIPVYNLGAAPSSWNADGHAGRRLAHARPDMFTGAVVPGGRHSDSMQSSSAAVQILAYLATGFSAPLNIVTNQLLSAGWISDMFHGTHTSNLYASSASPVSVLAHAWLTPSRGAQTARAASRPSVAGDACPAGSTALNCVDASL